MQRRTVLTAVVSGSLLVAAYAEQDTSSSTTTEPLMIKSTEKVSKEAFPKYNSTNNLSDRTVVAEAPEANAIYVFHTAQLPNPGHELLVNVSTDDENKNILVMYDSEDTTPEGSVVASVIDPQPHTLKITLSELRSDMTVTFDPIAGEKITYTTTGEKQTQPITTN